MIRSACLAFAASSLAVAATGCAGFAAERPKPNIIFVLADDMGYADLGCYGGQGVQSRNIDRLASEGIRFTQFYVNSPICSPSRTAFTTGQYPARWRITSYIDNRAANRRRGMAQWLDVKAPTLARSLSQAGYLTGHFGKWHLGGGRDVGEAPLPTEYGFSESLTQFEGLGDRVLPLLEGQDGQALREPQRMSLGVASEKLGRGEVRWEARSRVTGTFVSRALSFIQKAEQAGKPFYLNLWPDDVHSPFDPPPSLRGDGGKKALYRGVLSNMDAQLGPLFDAIRRSPKLRANTLVIFASDNGPEAGAGSAGAFKGSKGTLYEGGIREPLIVWGPGFIPQAKRGTVNSTAVLSAVDFLPSLLGIAGVRNLNPQGDGQDLGGTLVGKKPTGRTQPLFWKRPPDRGGGLSNPLPDLAVREGNWKLLIDEDGNGAQLYDLSNDQGERNNVAARHPQTAQRLEQIVLAWNRTLPASPQAAPQKGAGRFALRAGDHLDRDEAPQVTGRSFRLEATFDTRAPGGVGGTGVIVAQGGVANGYSLFVGGDSNLVFLVRRNKRASSVTVPSLSSGPHTARASIEQDGALALSLDGQPAIQSPSPGLFSQQPLDGLDVGSDQGGLVGPYSSPSRFSGTIQSVTIELADAK